MLGLFARAAGHGAIRHAERRGWLDLRYGFALMRDGRVPFIKKAAALGIGLALTVGLEALEVPLEAIVAAVLPIVGAGLDVVVDGVELITLPFIIAAALLPHMTRPRP